jgi:hypothetical protein
MSNDQRPIITSDGNETLAVIERVKRALSDNPKDFPTLTAAHLMGGPQTEAQDSRVRTEIDGVLPRDLRARATGAFLFKILRDANPILLYDVYLLQRTGFVLLLKETMRPDSLAHGLSDKELERAWEIFEVNMQILAKRGGQLRKRRDWR